MLNARWPSNTAGAVRMYVPTVGPSETLAAGKVALSMKSDTKAPSGALPPNVGVLSFVMLSLFKTPLSLSFVRSTAGGVNAR